MAENEVNNNAGCGCGAFLAIVGVVIIASGYNIALGVGAVVVGIAFGLWEMAKSKNEAEKQLEEARQRERHSQSASRLFELKEKQTQKPTITISVTTDKSDYEYSIKGINYCGIDDSMLGDFIGTARALKSNAHDPYAIGIYRGSKRVGFLPKGNQELYAKIMAVGGSVDADGYIAKDKEDGRTFYYGKVNLLGI